MIDVYIAVIFEFQPVLWIENPIDYRCADKNKIDELRGDIGAI